MMPQVPKAVWWAGGAVAGLLLIGILAKSVMPFALGLVCGTASAYFWIKGPR